jgi:tRNA threonylcarbamoyladenosine biosynthesis protein TsaB
MKILALELSTARGSLAWLNDAVDLVVLEWPNDRKNSGAFFENLAQVRKQFGLPDTIIVGLGPGSYAGTRIAISAAIGLQVASKARLLGFPSICAIENADYCVIGDARRQSFFFARIRKQELVEGPSLFSEEELKSKLKILDDSVPVFCSESLPQFPTAVVRYPSAELLARLGHDSNRSFKLPLLEPIYLREPHITLPKAQRIAS